MGGDGPGDALPSEPGGEELKIVDRDNSSQVLTNQGRLVIEYPTHGECKAFIIGYTTCARDARDRAEKHLGELVAELEAAGG